MLSREKRFKDEKENSPGPGQYVILPKITGGSLRYVKETKLKEKEPTPGPGAYHLPYSISVVPAFAIKKSKLIKSI